MKITPIIFSILSLFAFPSILNASQLDQTIFQSDPYDGKVNGEVRKGNLSASLSYRLKKENENESWTPRIEVKVNEKTVGFINGTASFMRISLIQIAEMDNTNQYPEVLFSSFTGGAHCCNEVVILTSDSQGRWFPVELAYFDGEPHEAEDVDKDGIYEYKTVDNSFLYSFAGYAESWAPPQIWRLKGSKFVDITYEPRFTFLYRNALNEMSHHFSEEWNDSRNPNGFLAAYVANKARVGKFEEGWNIMLKRYDKEIDDGLTDCKKYDSDKQRCVQEVKYKSYPEALRAFLIETGYIKK